MASPEVIAAIPNYNMSQTVVPLVGVLLEMPYSRVVVLDDASTDSSVEQLRSTYNFNQPQLTLVEGKVNVGAGGNRNRVLEVVDYTNPNSIVHFVDADTTNISPDSPEIITDILADPTIGAAGGQVRDEGERFYMNFGPKLNWQCLISAPLQERYAKLAKQNPQAAQQFRQKHNQLLNPWPDIISPPEARDVYWVQEANMATRALVFNQLKGFDPKLRFHEIQDLAFKMRQVNLRQRFDPSFETDRVDIHVRTQSRNLENVLNWMRLVVKYKHRQLI